MRRIMHKSLINPNGNWIAAANHLIGDEKAVAHAVIISVRGSAPRELGANMLISENQILVKINQRNEARFNKNYEEADKIRDELLDKGVLIEDKDGKTVWKFK